MRMLSPFLLVAMSRATATDPIDGMHTLPSVQSLGQPTSANVMAFHGGHIMGTTANISVYLLYYGNAWHDQSEQPTVDLVTHFVNHVSSSPYWGIVRSYNATPAAAAQLVVAQQLYVPAAAPTVDRASARSTLSATIADGTLPYDTQGIYVFLVAHDVVRVCPTDFKKVPGPPPLTPHTPCSARSRRAACARRSARSTTTSRAPPAARTTSCNSP